MTPTVPDGPDTELAAAIAYFRARDPHFGLHREDPAQVHAATIVRAVLARPAAGRDLTARDVEGAVNAWERGSYKRAVVEHLNGIARPAVARTEPPAQRFRRGDRVETVGEGERATVTGPAPRGPHGEPAVNLDWDGDAGGPAYEHDLIPTVARTDGTPPADLEGQALVNALVAAGWTRTGGQSGRYVRLKRDVPISNTALVPLDRSAPDYADLLSLAREEIGSLSAAPADDTAAPDPIETAARQLYAAIVAEHQRGETFPMRVSVCTNGLREALGETYPDDAPAAGQPVRDSQDGGDRG